MPLFEYLCSDCGAEFEKIVSSRTATVRCTHCDGARIEKKLSVFAVAGGRDDSSAEAFCGTCGSDKPGMCGR